MHPASAEARADAGLTWRRRALYALLTLMLFAAALEVVLRLVVADAPGGRLSVSRGFSPNAEYIVPDAARPGWWHTQMNGAEAPEVAVPPKGRALRVIMIGGSNVAGFQKEHLQQTLCAQLPNPGFEVVNLGRSGYGSERELILLKQALVLQPDVVLIYCGHNEFVEGGFAWELSQAWRPSVVRVADALLGLRTVNAAVDLLRGGGEPARLPEARRPRRKVFDDMTPERAAVFYDVFRDNLAAMVGACRAAGVRVLLATVVSNLFDPPYVSNPPADWDEARRAALVAARDRMLALVPARLSFGLVPEGPGLRWPHPRTEDWGENLTPTQRDERRAQAGPDVTAPALRPHAGVLAAAPFWTDPALWTPKVADAVAAFGRVCARELSEDERVALRAARSAGDEVLALCPDDPTTLYAQGLCTYMLGEDDARAAALLHAAAAADRAPTKGNDLINAGVRELAAAHAADAGLRFVDTDELWRARCPQGLPGYEVMLDSCHLHPAARLILVDDFAPALVELGRQALAER
ncbi:MAG TPA: SGNH/GDSL hydrolase family protein [Planctomycetota bacterium]|nr:SGNH/GDSL hydrolase family protein [Planctomycetota bacterium]